MAPRRWLLLLLSLASLVVLSYAAIVVSFSVPVTSEMAQANAAPELDGKRALILPMGDPALVPTFVAPQDARERDAPGAFLVVASQPADFPASTEDASLARALAWVPAGANDTLVLAGVPARNGTTNLSLDLAALSGGAAGFLVKGDAEDAPRFVTEAQVVGQVARYDTSLSVLALFVTGSIGFVAPLLLLVITHRGAGKRGPQAGGLHVCAECRAPLGPGMEFCTRCGAWASHKEGA